MYLKNIATDLKTLKCTSYLSDDAIVLLASVATKQKLSINDNLWKIGDPGEFIGLVVSGFFEITRYSVGDNEIAMGIFGPADVIGLSAVMRKTTYPGSSKALTNDSEIIKLHLRPVLQNRNSTAAELHLWVKEMLLVHEQILLDKIDILNAGTVEERVFEFIDHLIRRFGKRKSPVNYFVPIKLSRAQVAKMTGVRAETISRLFSRWQTQNLVNWTHDGILVENVLLLKKKIRSRTR